MRILASDIGGTNSRFAVFEFHDDTLRKVDETSYPTWDYGSFDEVLDRLRADGFGLTPETADVSVVAVPGYVVDKCWCKPANTPWEINVSELPSTWLINDFEAQAYSCHTPIMDDARVVHKGIPEEGYATAVMGAGTGLGQCALLELDNGDFKAVTSEFGHTAFPFIGKAEYEYHDFICAKLDRRYAYGDIVVTGVGLKMLHEFLTGRELEPREVAAEITPDSETTKWYARFYGRACRDYCLSAMALGGMYISGGIAAKNPGFVEHEEFRREFVDSVDFNWALERVPVLLNQNEDSGLWGAALYGQLKELHKTE